MRRSRAQSLFGSADATARFDPNIPMTEDTHMGSTSGSSDSDDSL